MFWISKLIILCVQEILCERTITTLKYSKHRVTPTIVQGNPAALGEIPYLVSIKYALYKHLNSTRWANLCGGTIIGSEKVLSAAHCFEGHGFFFVKNPTALKVVAGNIFNELTFNDAAETDSQWRDIIKIVNHKNFYFPVNDIALIFVTKPFVFDNHVNFIPVAKLNVDYSGMCRIAGFGKTDKENRGLDSEYLRVASLMVLPKWVCSNIWDMNMNSFICGTKSLVDVGSGDSGSPLTCEDTQDPSEDSTRGLLVGIVCGKNFDLSSLYTRVSNYHHWIETNSCDAKNFYIGALGVLILLDLYNEI